MPKEKVFKQGEITVAINNAIVMAGATGKLGKLTEMRRKRLREIAIEFAKPLTELIKEDVGGEVIKAEEAVFLVLCVAQLMHIQYVLGRHELPNGLASDEVTRALREIRE